MIFCSYVPKNGSAPSSVGIVPTKVLFPRSIDSTEGSRFESLVPHGFEIASYAEVTYG